MAENPIPLSIDLLKQLEAIAPNLRPAVHPRGYELSEFALVMRCLVFSCFMESGMMGKDSEKK